MAKPLNLFIVVNIDYFLISHRLPVALAAKNNGFNVTIVAGNTGYAEKIENFGLNFIAVPIKRTSTNIFSEIRTLHFLYSLYKRVKPDIIHHVGLKTILWGSLAAKFVKQPKVINAVSGLGYLFVDNSESLKRKAYLSLLKFALKSQQGNKWIFQNQDDLDYFKKESFFKNNSDVSLIKGSGVDLDEFNYVVENDDPVIKIIFPARMTYHKGIKEFVTAAQILKPRYFGKAKFILCGGVDLEHPTGIPESQLKQWEIENYLTWTGHQSGMAKVLSNAHIVAFPSYSEGLPKSLIEACAVGRPIITTDTTGCRECVIDGYNGYLVPIKDPIELSERLSVLIDSKELRIKMGENSRKLAEKMFSIHDVVDKTLTVYHSALGTGQVNSRKHGREVSI